MFLSTQFPVFDAVVSAVDTILPMLPPPKSIPGVDDAITKFLGWALYVVSVLSLVGLMIVLSVGFESYRHNQGEQLMEKAKAWVLAAIIGAYAKDIVRIFFPNFTAELVAIPIPGMDGPTRDLIGNIVWLLQWAAVACIVFLAAKGFIAFKNDGIDEFVGKFFWFIIGALGLSLATNIAGAFFPAVLKFG